MADVVWRVFIGLYLFSMVIAVGVLCSMFIKAAGFGDKLSVFFVGIIFCLPLVPVFIAYEWYAHLPEAQNSLIGLPK
jgi:hypothetical protein